MIRLSAILACIILLAGCSHADFDLKAYTKNEPAPPLSSSPSACCGVVCMPEPGDGVTDNTLSLQAAVTLAQNTTGALHLPNGDYKISAPITFLSKSLRITGAGATSTSVSQFPGAPITLFDMSNIGGPSVLVENMSFNGPATGGYGGTGIYVSASNGIILRNVWLRGLTKGVHKTNTASYVSQQHCVFEFCVVANHYQDGVQCTIADPVYYRNLTDLLLTGDAFSFLHSNSQHGETRNTGIHLDGAHGAQISGVTCRQDFDQQLPDIIRFTSGSSLNVVERVTTKSFGRVVVTMASGANCRNNRISGINALLVAPTPPTFPYPVNTLAAVLEIGASNTGNSFSAIQAKDCAACVVDVAGGNSYRDVAETIGASTVWVFP